MTGHLPLVLTFFAFMTLGGFAFGVAPRAVGDKVVVFVPPWSSPTNALEVIAAADGSFLQSGNWQWIALAQSDDPSFVKQLYLSGALFVGSGEAFSACFSGVNPVNQS